jgi:glutathione S-transferase
VWRERKRGWIHNGFDAPDVKHAILVFQKLLNDMNSTLAANTWLVGDEYSLADFALIPYANRLDMLGFSDMWRSLPHFSQWFETVRAQPSFNTALFDYLPEDLRTSMSTNGRNAWPYFQKVLADSSLTT